MSLRALLRSGGRQQVLHHHFRVQTLAQSVFQSGVPDPLPSWVAAKAPLLQEQQLYYTVMLLFDCFFQQP